MSRGLADIVGQELGIAPEPFVASGLGSDCLSVEAERCCLLQGHLLGEGNDGIGGRGLFNAT